MFRVSVCTVTGWVCLEIGPRCRIWGTESKPPGETGKTVASGGRCELHCLSGAFEPPCWKAPGHRAQGTGMVRARNFNHLSFTKASSYTRVALARIQLIQETCDKAVWWKLAEISGNPTVHKTVGVWDTSAMRTSKGSVACKIQRKSLDCNPAFDCLMMFDYVWL